MPYAKPCSPKTLSKSIAAGYTGKADKEGFSMGIFEKARNITDTDLRIMLEKASEPSAED